MTLPLVEPRAVLTPADEVERRIAGLQAALVVRELDAAVIVQNADLYYFAGTIQRSYLYVPAAGEATLFVVKQVERARLESSLAGIVELPRPADLPGLVIARYGGLPRRLGLELDVLPVSRFRRLQDLFPEAVCEDIGRAVVEQRAVKSAWEVERIRAAARIAVEVCGLIPGILREGLTEAEFAGRVEAEARRLGHEGVIRMRGFNEEMFYGQLLSGSSATATSYLDTPLAGTGLSPAIAQGVSFKRIGRGEPVVFDFVPVSCGYIADFTRMFVIGEPPPRVAAACDASLRIQAAVVAAARPGVSCRELYELALRTAAAEGLADSFMGYGSGQVRFVGHGVGVELDELPVIAATDRPLAQGNVFALEPKFVLPGLGAAGVENTWHVSAGGLECLTSAPESMVRVE